MEITEILRHGITTEKSVKLQELHKYTFKVAPRANKIEIRRAVEEMFNVKVVSVNVMRMHGKARMFRRKGAAPRPQQGRDWKKAIVTLQEGYTIDALKA